MNDALSVASINGTIIAIVFAAVLGYGLIVFQSYERRVTELLDHANDVLQDLFQRTWHFGPEIKAGDFDALEALEPALLVKVLAQLANGEEAKLSEARTVSPTEEARRGSLIVCGVQKVLARDPFRPSSAVVMGTFRRPEEVDAWLPRVSAAIEGLSGILEPYHPLVDLSVLMAAADAREDAAISTALENTNLPPKLIHSLEGMRGRNSQRLSAAQERVADYRRNVARLTRQLERLDDYRQRATPRRLIGIVCLGLIASFGCGVAAPMFDQSTPKVVSVWIPVALYGLGLVLGSVFVLSNSGPNRYFLPSRSPRRPRLVSIKSGRLRR